MISSLFSSGSPPQPSSASVTTTATGTTATSSPTTTTTTHRTNTTSSANHSTGGGGGGGGPSTTTSVSSPPVGGAAHPLPHAPLHPPPAAGARAPASSAAAATTTTTRMSTSSHIQTSLPSPRSQRAEADARAAVVASISNMLDGELQSRAALLHENNAAIDKQRRDVEKAVVALRKEDDKLQKVADDAARRVKEVGDVQNWAELLEKDFLVLEETLRLAREGGGDDHGRDDDSCCSGSGSCCYSGSYTGSYSGSEAGGDGGDAAMRARKDAEGDVAMGEGGGEGIDTAAAAAADALHAALLDDMPDASDVLDKGKGKELAAVDATTLTESMELDEPHHDMSEASRSNADASSSHTMTDETGKSSETTSLCAPTTGSV